MTHGGDIWFWFIEGLLTVFLVLQIVFLVAAVRELIAERRRNKNTP